MSEAFHVSDDDLNCYYLDAMEESDAAVVEEHLLSCQDCLDRAEACERDNQENGLAERGHVTTEDLERYHLGHLKIAPTLAIKKHAAECQECADRMLAVERFIMFVRVGVIGGEFDKEVED